MSAAAKLEHCNVDTFDDGRVDVDRCYATIEDREFKGTGIEFR